MSANKLFVNPPYKLLKPGLALQEKRDVATRDTNAPAPLSTHEVSGSKHNAESSKGISWKVNCTLKVQEIGQALTFAAVLGKPKLQESSKGLLLERDQLA